MSTMAAPATRIQSLTGLTRWRVLAGAILVQLILGTVYGYSVFSQLLEANVFPKVITEAERVQMVAAGQSVEGMTVVADESADRDQHEVQRGYLKYAFSICILSAVLAVALHMTLKKMQTSAAA